MSAPLQWVVLEDGALPGAVNMARDHTLAEWCPPGTGLLRFYTWERPTLSLGRNEPARDVYDPDALRVMGVDVVRRPTGGRSVLHHRELTYAVVVPLRILGAPRAVYGLVNEGLARGLVALGAPAAVAGAGPVAGLDAGACFRTPAPGEVVASGRKLVGSAQARIGDALLQHGSILLENDQDLLRELRYQASPSDTLERPVTLLELLGAVPPLQAIRDALIRGLAERLGGDWRGDSTQGSFGDPGPPREPSLPNLDRYRSWDWTWRR